MANAPTTIQKAFAYITQENRLLVFSHVEFPQAGIQVPAGTIEPGELASDAVLRVSAEESGLHDLRIVHELGSSTFDRRPLGRNEIDQRHFFHLVSDGHIADNWEHHDVSGTASGRPPLLLAFTWLNLDAKPAKKLIADHGAMIAKLRWTLKNEQPSSGGD